MSTRKHQAAVDEISAKNPTLKLVLGGLPAMYKENYSITDFADDDTPNLRAVRQLIGGLTPLTQTIRIPAETPIPFNIVMNTDYEYLGINPTFIFLIPKAGDLTNTKFRQFSDIYADSNFSDASFSQLLSIDVWGHDNGAGLFAEDTLIIMKV